MARDVGVVLTGWVLGEVRRRTTTVNKQGRRVPQFQRHVSTELRTVRGHLEWRDRATGAKALILHWGQWCSVCGGGDTACMHCGSGGSADGVRPGVDSRRQHSSEERRSGAAMVDRKSVV